MTPTIIVQNMGTIAWRKTYWEVEIALDLSLEIGLDMVRSP
jgi:hypothetical protein